MRNSSNSASTVRHCIDFIAQDPTLLSYLLFSSLRSDHAGEIGAVWVYKGILKGSTDPEVREFAKRHLVVETHHLELMGSLLNRSQHSYLLPLWRAAGFLIGYIPALLGPRAVFVVIEAVETFVEDHYEDQIIYLQKSELQSPSSHHLLLTLKHCLEGEKEHKHDAQARLMYQSILLDRLVQRLVYGGSTLAVSIARRL